MKAYQKMLQVVASLALFVFAVELTSFDDEKKFDSRKLSVETLNDTNIHDAVSAYLSDETNAIAVWGNIKDWDVSGVTSMMMLWTYKSVDYDLSRWDVSSVTDMYWMFSWVNIRSPTGIGAWDVSNVVDFSCMLESTTFNEDISGWDTSSAKNMYKMFRGAHNFNQDISSWDVGNVRDMQLMFDEAISFNQDISSWNVGNLRYAERMFHGATAFDQVLWWDLASLQDDKDMFTGSNGELGVGVRPLDVYSGGDPVFVGFHGQAFKFNGRDKAWYAVLGTSNFQWNSKFSYFKNCPDESDTFVTAISMMFFNSTKKNSLSIRVNNETVMFPGCSSDEHACLGRGSLGVLLDGNEISTPGEYKMVNGGGRIVVHNTFGACSKKWYDFHNDTRVSRSLSLKSPLNLLMLSRGDMLDPEKCNDWIKDRSKNDDLFLQNGHWTTVYIDTPSVSFHVEYRKSTDVNCMSHSIDAWITRVSADFEADEWTGIMGETKSLKYYPGSKEVMTDRLQILKGKEDSDYEVGAMDGVDFVAKHMK